MHTMTMRLIQKHLLKGTRLFEITDDAIFMRIKSLFRQERVTVSLSALDPEPVVNKSELEFYGRDTSAPMVSLFLDEPNADEFAGFVRTLKQRILEEQRGLPESGVASQPPGMEWNVHDEPPDFDEPDPARPRSRRRPVDPAKVDDAIQLLQKYLEGDDIKPLIAALEALSADPGNEACIAQLEAAFNELGIRQGAVLTYAPYVSILLSDNPYGD